MNLLDAVVTEVLGEPVKVTTSALTYWKVPVTASCWGQEKDTVIVVSTEELAKAVSVGYKFLM